MRLGEAPKRGSKKEKEQAPNITLVRERGKAVKKGEKTKTSTILLIDVAEKLRKM